MAGELATLAEWEAASPGPSVVNQGGCAYFCSPVREFAADAKADLEFCRRARRAYEVMLTLKWYVGDPFDAIIELGRRAAAREADGEGGTRANHDARKDG